MIELNQRYEIKITPIHFIYSKSKEGIFKSIFIIHKLYIRYDIHKFETGLIYGYEEILEELHSIRFSSVHQLVLIN